MSLFKKSDKKTKTKIVTGDVENKEEAFFREYRKPLVAVMCVLVLGLAVVLPLISRSKAATATYSLWSSTTVPKVVTENDAQAVELGVRFKADVDGQIKGVKFYKSSKNTGQHTGKLYDANGTRLARAVFSDETSSGWQSVNFSSPVDIKAGTVYTASYYTPRGYYSDDTNYFASVFNSGPLHALKDGDGGPNGVYRYGDGYPTEGYKASNYWVDVLFTANVNLPAPSNLSGVAVNAKEVDLQWDAVTGAAKYQVYRNGSAIGGTVTANNFGDNGVVANTTYSYYVKSINVNGTYSGASNTISVKTPGATPATCPVGQTGTPPNCSTPTCPVGQTGTPPNCSTPTCPAGQTGIPPNCVTPPVSGGSGALCSVIPSVTGVKPTASNTGVPAGTVLTASGSITVTTPGTVINAKDVSGSININANNVTIQNTRINGSGFFVVKIADNVTGTKILSSTIYTTNGGYEGILGGNFTACGNDISGFENPITVVGSNTIVQDNYIHNLNAMNSGAHYDGIEIYGGSNSVFYGNNILMTNKSGGQLGETGAINLTAYQGDISNTTISGNWLDGGTYTLYVDEQSGSQANGIVVTNNRFGPNHAFGTHLIRRSASVTVFSGNVNDSNGSAVGK